MSPLPPGVALVEHTDTSHKSERFGVKLRPSRAWYIHNAAERFDVSLSTVLQFAVEYMMANHAEAESLLLPPAPTNDCDVWAITRQGKEILEKIRRKRKGAE